MLSVVIPAYNEEENIFRAGEVISNILSDAQIENELIFVNDGSKDKTWDNIQELAGSSDNVRGLCFSRNFGKEAAILAGLSAAKGECVVVIDADLQHPPEKIVEMYRLWEDGVEIVEGVKSSRGKESKAHGLAARIFYSMISKSVKIDMMHASDFKLLDRKAVDVIVKMPERFSFFRAISSWVGFESATVAYDVREREAGVTKWSTRSLIKYAISNITSFSATPMHVITYMGILILLFSLIFSIISVIQKIAGVALGGFTTVIIMIGFIGSMIMISLGIIGYYISKIYEELKGRPRYIISKEV